jgi:uncharacterized membrane protein
VGLLVIMIVIGWFIGKGGKILSDKLWASLVNSGLPMVNILPYVLMIVVVVFLVCMLYMVRKLILRKYHEEDSEEKQ